MCLCVTNILVVFQELELELEDFGSSGSEESSSELSRTDNDDTTTNYTTARTSEIFRIADPTHVKSNRENTRDQLMMEQNEFETSTELVPFAGERSNGIQCQVHPDTFLFGKQSIDQLLSCHITARRCITQSHGQCPHEDFL